MKNRLVLSASLLSLAALSFACGDAATNANNSNTNRSNTMMSNSNSNMMSNSNNMMSNSNNMMSNTAANKPANTATNTAANKPAAGNANTATNKIATTQKPPKGATAVCKDGTYSFSKTESGQCSGHGGVDKKL